MTLDEFVNSGGSDGELWRNGAVGLRTQRGRVVWTNAMYPDGSNGNRVQVSRFDHDAGGAFTRVAYYDRDMEIILVDANGKPVKL